MAPSQPSKIAFIKLGSFSHLNANVGAMLREQFADYQVDEIDVEDLLADRSVADVFNAGHILRYYGLDILRQRRSFADCKFRTPYMFARIAKLLQRRLGRDISRYAFSFQTQSLYDAGIPNLPHFVYTDHTHLANLSYPDFRRSQLFARAWIDLEASIYRNAARVFTMSRHVQRSLLKDYHCAPERVACVFAAGNAGSDPVPLRNDNYRNQRILFAGVDWERKGGPELVDAFKIVQQRHPEARLTIVGCSPRLELRNCDVVGRVPIQQMKDFYAQASVFCMPTRVEPFGIVFIESLLNRIPVVATKIGALPDIVEPGKSGYLVEPSSPEELAGALSELLSDPEKCRRFGEYGYRATHTRYSWDSVGKRIRQEIKAALSTA